ncbi:MAG: flagellar hook-associated protein FlgK [Propionivibrio sp.]
MGSGIFSIGASALQNAQLGLATTSHNISNASTAGYNRQRIVQVANAATLTGSGYVGRGAHVSNIERIYSSYLVAQVNVAQSSVSRLESYSTAISQLSSVLLDDSAGLSSALEGFFTGVQQVNSDPSSLTTRQTMVSAANTLTARFQSLSSLVSSQYQSINGQVQGYVNSINSYSEQIATLNKQIIVAESSSNQIPNDLYDQRDQLVAELNKLIGVKTTTNSNGSYNVFFGNGQQLVVGTKVSSLAAIASSDDPSRLTVGIVNPSATVELPESVITGGSLGGILQYRSETLDTVANELGRTAASLALTFNAQHALGQDLLGSIEGDSTFVADFFKVSAPTVIANTNNPLGSAEVTAEFSPASYSSDGTFYTNLTTSDYRLTSDGSNLTLTRLSDNVSWSGATITALNTAIETSSQGSQGFTLSSTGSFPAGSSYLIQPTRLAAQSVGVNSAIAADVRQIAVAAPIRASVGTSNTGTATITAGSVVPSYSAPASGAPVTLTYSSSNGGELTGFSSYPVTVTANGVMSTINSGAVPYTTGATISFAGMSFTISGTPKNGDTFVIAKNTNGVSDNRNSLLLAQLQSAKTMAGNTASYSTIYAQLVSSVGNKGGEVQTILTAQTTLLSEAQSARDSVSGVNLDEEAIKLLEYQQSYQAAAKMLEIASKLFDSLLSIG